MYNGKRKGGMYDNNDNDHFTCNYTNKTKYMYFFSSTYCIKKTVLRNPNNFDEIIIVFARTRERETRILLCSQTGRILITVILIHKVR